MGIAQTSTSITGPPDTHNALTNEDVLENENKQEPWQQGDEERDSPMKIASGPNANNTPSDAPYSVLPAGEKALVIIAGSFAALISPLSSSIYLPAMTSIAQEMDVSVSLINLTITTYLVRILRSCNWANVP